MRCITLPYTLLKSFPFRLAASRDAMPQIIIKTTSAKLGFNCYLQRSVPGGK